MKLSGDGYSSVNDRVVARVLWGNSCDVYLRWGVYGRFDGKSRFVELVDNDIIVNNYCVGTTDNSTMDSVNAFMKGLSLANKFSCEAIATNVES